VRWSSAPLASTSRRSTAAALEAESGFSLETTAVSSFRSGVLDGSWPAVEQLLVELPQDEIADLAVSPCGPGPTDNLSSAHVPNFVPPVQTVRFLIRQQKFLEALERKETKAGLRILRNELTPLVSGTPSNRLHFLSRLVEVFSGLPQLSRGY